MLPTGEEADRMEQSTLNYVFNLFGKGVSQMLQTNVNQQTLIDELRSQVRSLQTQVSNLVGSIDEIENRIFVRMQSMQPTIYTREGIPFDDALDTLTAKLQTTSEKVVNNIESINRLDVDLQNKIDREEYLNTMSESNKAAEAYSDLSVGLQNLQKELQKQRQETLEANEHMFQSMRIQIQQQNNSSSKIESHVSGTINSFVTHDELQMILSHLNISKSHSIDTGLGSLDFNVSTENLTEEKVSQAIELLKKKQIDLDTNYSHQKNKIDDEYQKLYKFAESNATISDPENWVSDEFEEEEEISNEPDIRDYISVAVGNDSVERFDPVSLEYNPSGMRRSIGLFANVMKTLKSSPSKISVPEVPIEEDVQIDIEEVLEDAPKKPKTKKNSRKKKPIKTVVEKIKANKPKSGLMASPSIVSSQALGRFDEAKVMQKVMDVVMPRVENLLIDAFSGGKGGQSGLKLEKHEAKQLIEQLSLLDGVRTELKNMKIKVALKMDKGKIEQELRSRLTKDEFFAYLHSLFPDNPRIDKELPVSKARLPPLNQGQPPKRNDGEVSKSTDDSKVQLTKKKGKGPLSLVPARNSKMLSLNQKYLRGADGRYYFRDVSQEQNSTQSSNTGIFGSEEVEDSTVSAAFDFQPYMPSSSMRTKESVGAPSLGNIREQTPNNNQL